MRLIRTACKAFGKHGSEQSGAYMAFSTYLTNNYNIKRVPLASFRGNRFNILFYDAGALYHLQSAISGFFSSGLSTSNLLLKAVEADATVPELWAGCRALGLLNKFVTGPFWRLLESDFTILEMNARYEHMVSCFEQWAKDASEILSGEACLFIDFPPSIDPIYDSLLKSSDNDPIVQEILQYIFAAFSVLLHRMVKDHLPGGEHTKLPTQFHSQTLSVPKTNVVSERDFAQLDRLLRQKLNATTIALKGMIMFANNKTAQWLNSKTEEQRARLLKMARNKTPDFRMFHLRRQRKKKELGYKDRSKKSLLPKRLMNERRKRD